MSQGSGSTTKNKAIYEATCIYGRKKNNFDCISYGGRKVNKTA